MLTVGDRAHRGYRLPTGAKQMQRCLTMLDEGQRRGHGRAVVHRQPADIGLDQHAVEDRVFGSVVTQKTAARREAQRRQTKPDRSVWMQPLQHDGFPTGQVR